MHWTREAGGRGGSSAAGDAGGGVPLPDVPPCAHTRAPSADAWGTRQILVVARVAHADTFRPPDLWFGSPAVDAPSCLGGVTPRSLEVHGSKHQPRRPAMYSEMS